MHPTQVCCAHLRTGPLLRSVAQPKKAGHQRLGSHSPAVSQSAMHGYKQRQEYGFSSLCRWGGPIVTAKMARFKVRMTCVCVRPGQPGQPTCGTATGDEEAAGAVSAPRDPRDARNEQRILRAVALPALGTGDRLWPVPVSDSIDFGGIQTAFTKGGRREGHISVEHPPGASDGMPEPPCACPKERARQKSGAPCGAPGTDEQVSPKFSTEYPEVYSARS